MFVLFHFITKMYSKRKTLSSITIHRITLYRVLLVKGARKVTELENPRLLSRYYKLLSIPGKEFSSEIKLETKGRQGRE